LVIRKQLAPWKYHKQCHPNRVALSLCSSDNSIEMFTWQQLCERVDHYQKALVSNGMQAGDILTLVGKNHPDTVFWLLASFQHGVVCALTMPQPASQLSRKLDTLYRPEQTPFIWCAPECGVPVKELERTVKPLVLSSNGQPVPNEGYQQSNLATIIFTSGSTGNPKAVVHQHSQHLASAQGLLEQFHFTESDTWLLSLPLYHVSGLAIIYRWLQAGACLKIGAGNLLQDISGVTHASLVPTQLKRLLDSEQLLTISHVLLGGSHIPHTLSQQAANLGIETWLGYGMTEAASTVTAKPVDETSTAGCVLPGRALKIADKTIYVSGDTLAVGYYCQGALHPLTGEDGWFNTRDLGQWHGDELVIIGRADNLFISGGENIHCEEIEAVLNQHPDIELAMVIPVADPEFGARPIAAIAGAECVSKQKGDVWCKGKLEKFKWPIDYVEMPGSLRETGIKVSRKALQGWFFTTYKNYQSPV